METKGEADLEGWLHRMQNLMEKYEEKEIGRKRESLGERPGTAGSDILRGVPRVKIEATKLDEYAGDKGRNFFFEMARKVKEAPSNAERAKDLIDEGSQVQGAAARMLLNEFQQRALPPRPLLSRVITKSKHLKLTALGLGDNFASALVPSLGALNEFEQLSLADNKLSDISLPAILEKAGNMPNLRILDLSRNDIDGESALALRQLVANEDVPLETLKLEHADVDDEECCLLCSSMVDNKNSKLKTLELADNLIGVKEGLNAVNPDFVTGGEALSEILQYGGMQSLTKLNLSWNFIRGDSAVAFARSLATNNNLIDLNLSYNAFGCLGTQELGRALAKNCVLQVLDLTNNAATPKATFVLAHNLRRAAGTSKLTHLNLSGNKPGHIGACAILHAIRDCKGALSIKLDNCTFDYSKEQHEFFKSSTPGGEYKLYLDLPYDRMVACELLHVATVRAGCRFKKLRYHPGNDHDISEDEAKPIDISRPKITEHQSRHQTWAPVLAAIFENYKLPPHLLKAVFEKCHLFPSTENLRLICNYVDERLREYFEVDQKLKKWNEERERRLSAFKHNIADLFQNCEAQEDDDDDNASSSDEDEDRVLLPQLTKKNASSRDLQPPVENANKKKRRQSTLNGPMCPAALCVNAHMSYGNDASLLKEKSLLAAATAVRFGILLARASKQEETKAHTKDALSRGKLTHEVVLSLIFRGVFQLMDKDGNGDLDATEIAECGKVLGLDMDEAETERIIVAYDDGDGSISESEFCAYMFSLFLVPPEARQGDYIDQSTKEVWKVPESGILWISFQADPSIATIDEIGSDAGVESLLALIKACNTEDERLALFQLATNPGSNGGYFTAAQAQRVIDTCASSELDSYDMCKRLAFAMASPDDCQHILSVNLTLDQAVSLYCEVGPAAWRRVTGNLSGHYALDIAVERDRKEFLSLCAAAHVERVKAIKAKFPDTTQHGDWKAACFRNVRINRKDWQQVFGSVFDPEHSVHELPATGIISFDLISFSRPTRTDQPVSALRFQELLKAIEAADWKDAAKMTAAEAIAERRARVITASSPLAGRRTIGTADPATPNSNGQQQQQQRSSLVAEQRLNNKKRAPKQKLPDVKPAINHRPQSSKLSTRDYEPVWPARRNHKLLTAENVAAYYIEFLDSSIPADNGIDYFNNTEVRYARLGFGAGVGLCGTNESLHKFLPNIRALSWLHIKLILFEFLAGRLFFRAEQVVSLWSHLPTDAKWLPCRIQLATILFRRTIDIENLPSTLFEAIPRDDVCQLRHRLGALNLLSARAPDGYHQYQLHIWDEHQATAVCVALASVEPGENWIDGRFRRSRGWAGADWMPGWSLPTTWSERIVDEGIVEFTYVSPAPDWGLRDELMKRLLTGVQPLIESKLRVDANGVLFRR